jgi:hypothetical protein
VADVIDEAIKGHTAGAKALEFLGLIGVSELKLRRTFAAGFIEMLATIDEAGLRTDN